MDTAHEYCYLYPHNHNDSVHKLVVLTNQYNLLPRQHIRMLLISLFL